jgi:hypothetical protein
MIERKEQAGDEQADERRHSQQIVQEDLRRREPKANAAGFAALTEPMIISIGASTRLNRCHANSLTRSTSVVINVMTCALLENSSSFFFSASGPSSAGFAPFSLVFGAAAEDATSLRTRVFAKRIELSWTCQQCRYEHEGNKARDSARTFRRTWNVVVLKLQSWPVTEQSQHGYQPSDQKTH